jgi:predicted RNA-binding protein YlxR (DUF448 family)
MQGCSSERRSSERTCIACGTKNSPDAFLRVRFHNGALTLGSGTNGHKLFGRSAYLCPRAACVEKAIAKRAFARSFRTDAFVSDALKQQLRATVATVADTTTKNLDNG